MKSVQCYKMEPKELHKTLNKDKRKYGGHVV